MFLGTIKSCSQGLLIKYSNQTQDVILCTICQSSCWELMSALASIPKNFEGGEERGSWYWRVRVFLKPPGHPKYPTLIHGVWMVAKTSSLCYSFAAYHFWLEWCIAMPSLCVPHIKVTWIPPPIASVHLDSRSYAKRIAKPVCIHEVSDEPCEQSCLWRWLILFVRRGPGLRIHLVGLQN
jgi:hypothetical protein